MIQNAALIDGWMSEQELYWLARAANKSKVIIEIGSYKGRSTRALADNTDGIVYAIDPWSGIYLCDDGSIHGIKTDVLPDFLRNMQDHVNSKKVKVCIGKVEDYASLPPADLIFIDGDHRYKAVKDDIDFARKHLNEGGIIAGHDYSHADWPSVKRAVDEEFPNAEKEDSIWYYSNQLK